MLVKTSSSIITVDLGKISDNVAVLQLHCRAGVQQMVIVKAGAYGHGAVKVARKIADKVAGFAVNDIYEGIYLRENCIDNPILVFGVPKKREEQFYSRYDITATISNSEHFKLLDEGTEYHLNFDTGMNRLGFRPEQIEAVVQLKENHPELNCTGIYSHFATADEGISAKIENQLLAFKKIRAQFDDDLITHMCNTAGLVQCPEAQFDVVRTGIGVYGYSPGEVTIPNLKPAISWKTHLVQVNPIRKSERVSYGATWSAKKDGYIGIIPVGYSDGIPRGLSGNFEVAIEGKSYPVAGTVTMNYCMIDLGSKPIGVGTDVYLWNETITPQDWANKMDTIPYEILTGLSSKIHRKYIQD